MEKYYIWQEQWWKHEIAENIMKRLLQQLGIN